MKKVKRNPEKFEALELFSSLASQHGYGLDCSTSIESFISRIKLSLDEMSKNPITLHGKRAESMFAYVVGGIGKVELLKKEDSGDFYYKGDNTIIPPDYRLFLSKKEQLFVEVKNCNKDRFVLKKNYLNKLKAYSNLNQVELMFAIYFAKKKVWSLLPLSSFIESKTQYAIDFDQAVIESKMDIIGDCFIIVESDIELQYMLSNEEVISFQKDEFILSVQLEKVDVFFKGKKICGELEKKVAMFLLMYGNWKSPDVEKVVSDGAVKGFKFSFKRKGNSEQFNNCGNLSYMISLAFLEYTTGVEDKIRFLDLSIDPSEFDAIVFGNYESNEFQIMRLHVHKK